MKRGVLQRSEVLLWVVGTLLLLFAGSNLLRYYAFQSLASNVQSIGSLENGGGSLTRGWKNSLLLSPMFNQPSSSIKVAGKLEVVRLGFSVLVVDGDEEEGLSVAAVHLAGSSPLGGAGNAVIAGHRDTAFWPLRNLRIGDQIRIRAGHRYLYTVRSIRIVAPNDVSVLQTATVPTLTLVTCYPFRYIGNAPKRYVIQASKNS